MIQSWKYQYDVMLLFLLVFNLIEINATNTLNTKCKRYYTRPPESSFLFSLGYTFNLGLLPDLSKWREKEQDHFNEFACGEYCIDVSLARLK